jgi:hypothetical protein
MIYFINNYAIRQRIDFVNDLIPLNLLSFDTNRNIILLALEK